MLLSALAKKLTCAAVFVTNSTLFSISMMWLSNVARLIASWYPRDTTGTLSEKRSVGWIETGS